MNKREEFVINKLKENNSAKLILDIGFIGEYDTAIIHEKILSNIKKDQILDGLDFRDDFELKTRNIKKINIKGQYWNQDLYKLKLQNKYDLIFLLEVLEHLENPYQALKIICKSLKKGGKLIITYPNPIRLGVFKYYFFQRNLLKKSFVKLYKGASDHIIFPFPMSLVNYFEINGMEVIDVKFIKGYFSGLPFLNKFSTYIGVEVIKK
jgi:2-polyprenyl-3-methyl-5-hydroxy-6-metoxy-1,4-benzoquinol methylase